VVGRPEGNVNATSKQLHGGTKRSNARAGKRPARASGMFFWLMTTVNGALWAIFSAT
jgi:hypothetical protein